MIAAAFAELGYRRATTAELAARCDVQENTLFRLWGDQKSDVPRRDRPHIHGLGRALATAAQRRSRRPHTRGNVCFDYEASHHGETGLYRIVFAGLSEADDPEIAAALRRMFRRYHKVHRGADRGVSGRAWQSRPAGPTDLRLGASWGWACVRTCCAS